MDRSIVTAFLGRSRSRRGEEGGQFGPYGMYAAARYPFDTSSPFRESRTPCSIANSKGTGWSRASFRARSIMRLSWVPRGGQPPPARKKGGEGGEDLASAPGALRVRVLGGLLVGPLHEADSRASAEESV